MSASKDLIKTDFHQSAFAELQKTLDSGSISTKKADLYRTSMDNLRISRLPSVHLTPQDEGEVESILAIANQYQVPITTRGAGSATTGSSAPTHGGWVLDLSQWNAVEIDPVSKMAYAQPGATIESIDQLAQEQGLFYPPDPGSKKYATIGGTIATNAGGLRGAKYGVTRDYVLSLEGFLPTGEFVRWGSNLKKFSAGFNIRDLWIGSEGMLGVITGCVLKLLPHPKERTTAILTFDSASSILEAMEAILETPSLPSVMEFLDDQTTQCTAHFWKRLAPQKLKQLPGDLGKVLKSSKSHFLLLMEFDGDSKPVVRKQFQTLQRILKAIPHQEYLAQNEQEAEILWQIRRGCSQAMFELADTKINEDIVIPISAYGDLLRLTHEIKENYGLHTPTFGHAADGNFHVHIMYNRKLKKERHKAAQAIDHLMNQIIDLGGAISGEHGIGLAKSNYLPLQHSDSEISTMRKIKATLDPNNILNPDKLFTPFTPWDHRREEVKMPWDH